MSGILSSMTVCHFKRNETQLSLGLLQRNKLRVLQLEPFPPLQKFILFSSSQST